MMVSYSSLCVYWRWPRPLKRFQVLAVFVSCFFLHLSIGSTYTYGNVLPYLVSYARNRSEPANLRSTEATYVFSVQVAGLGVGMLAGGLLEKLFGPRLVTLCGGWLMSLGVALTFFAIQKNFWILLVTYGVMFGLGTGVAYIGPMACAIRWLPNRKGLASGIVVSGFGISSLIFTTIQTAYINPDNVEPIGPICDVQSENCGDKYFLDSGLLDRVPKVFLLLAAIYASLQLVMCVFLVNPPPSSTNQEHDPIVVPKKSSTPPAYSPSTSMCHSNLVNRAIEASVVNVVPSKLVCQPSFYLLWIMFCCVGIEVTFVTSLYKSFGLEQVTTDDRFLSIVGAVSSCFNLLGRILWGVMADVTSYKLALVLQVAMSTCLLFTFYATSAGGKAMFAIWLCSMFFCIGGNFSLYPSLVAQLYGTENIGINYSLVYSSQIFGSILASIFSHLLIDFIRWYGVFFVIASVSLLEFVLALSYCNRRYSTS